MNGAPKHVENVGCGSLTPISVPASFAVNPERNQYCACSGVRRASGGRIPNASAVRNTTLRGWPAILSGWALGISSSS